MQLYLDLRVNVNTCSSMSICLAFACCTHTHTHTQAAEAGLRKEVSSTHSQVLEAVTDLRTLVGSKCPFFFFLLVC